MTLASSVFFETKDEAATHKYCRTMTVVEYPTKENENK